MRDIIVCPLHDVEAIARLRQPSHILSLISPSATATGFEQAVPHHMELRFNDITKPSDGLLAPSSDHIRQILAFSDAVQPHDSLLVHCWAGVSRSTAAAYIVACQYLGAGYEETIAQQLRALAPYATPNKLMIELADAALSRSGAMTRSIAQIGRGHDTAWGAAFTLKL